MLPPIYFISGASAPADIWGLAGWSVPLGVSLPELSSAALALLSLQEVPEPVKTALNTWCDEHEAYLKVDGDDAPGPA